MRYLARSAPVAYYMFLLLYINIEGWGPDSQSEIRGFHSGGHKGRSFAAVARIRARSNPSNPKLHPL